MYMYIIT